MMDNLTELFLKAQAPYMVELPEDLLIEVALDEKTLEKIKEYARDHSLHFYEAFTHMIKERLQNFLESHGEQSNIEIKYHPIIVNMSLVASLDFDARFETIQKLEASTNLLYEGLEWSDNAKKAGFSWGLDPA